jgi:hypothetical protein
VKKKFGPLPVWGYVAIVVAGLGYLWYRNKQSAAAATQSSSTDALGFGSTPTNLAVTPGTGPTITGLSEQDLVNLIASLQGQGALPFPQSLPTDQIIPAPTSTDISGTTTPGGTTQIASTGGTATTTEGGALGLPGAGGSARGTAVAFK